MIVISSSMPAFIDLTDKNFGRLTILEHTGRPGRPKIMWKYRCSCGNEGFISRGSLENGHTRSCGCFNIEEIKKRRTTHGATTNRASTSTYNIWTGMKGRCTNQNNTIWKHYGGRGITFCERWQTFENFLADMGERPGGMSLERVNNDLGYSPDNCIWATRAAQSVNKRNTRFVFVNGQRRPFATVCEEYGVRYQSMWTRERRLGRPLTAADFEAMKQKTTQRNQYVRNVPRVL